MNITYVQFAGSNPSMGPHNSPSSNTLQMGSRQEALADLLDNTTVNGTASLRDYLAMRLRGDDSAVQKVHEGWQPGQLYEGQRIIDLTVGFADGRSVTLSDLRYFSLTGEGYRRFEALIREEGSVSQEPSEFELKDIIQRPEPALDSSSVRADPPPKWEADS